MIIKINFQICLIVIFLMIGFSTKYVKGSGGAFSLVRSFLQENVAGNPIIHAETKWDFNPDKGIKQRNLFYERNGYRAVKHIERIGVGLDGKNEERRKLQAIRDEGKLNGEHNINFP